MSDRTKIQWTDSTVNPVAGCNGCELFPTSRHIVHMIENLLLAYIYADRVPNALREEMLSQGPTEIRRDREKWAQRIAAAADTGGRHPALTADIEKSISSMFRCYAGNLTNYINASGAHPGYPKKFEEPTAFPGRTAKAAKSPVLTGKERPDKPWLNALPRIQFISDMGDALSREIGFDYLKEEIVDVVVSDNGRCHVWIWLTKRPSRMAEFAGWLAEQGVAWPDNLVPATTITDRQTLTRLDHLRQVPARFRMVSIEPLVEEVVPDLTGIDWVIVGGESGHYARPFEVSWLRGLQSACSAHQTAFFVKQLGARPLLNEEPLVLRDGHGGDWTEWPEEFRIREVPAAWRDPETWLVR